MTIEEIFDHYTDQALAQLPEPYRQQLDNVSVFVEDYPTRRQFQKLKLRHGHTLLGLYEGIPKTQRGNYGIGGPLPDRITLFRGPILARARTEDHLAKLIRDTLYHEIGHHFGMSEAEIRRTRLHRVE